MTEAVIVAAVRSPIGRAMKGSLIDVRPDDLATQMVNAALAQVPALPAEAVDDLMLGCAEPVGEAGWNLGRVVAVRAGFDFMPATTVNRFCSSSLQTTRMAFHAIRSGEGDAFISAGVESVSRGGAVLTDGRSPESPFFGPAQERTAGLSAGGTDHWVDPRQQGLIPDVYIGMGQTAENLALVKDVSRADMDEFSVRSQLLAQEARRSGFWDRDITPITLPGGSSVTRDDGPREGVTYEGLAALRPVFRPDGRVTAGNCCALNDGAAALIVTSDTKAAELGLAPLARIVATAVSGLSPEIMGYGPVEASRRALARAGMTIDDVDLVEINEAFAAQVLPCQRDLGIEMDRLNVNGGAIAVGHPFGMSGARIATTLIHSLQARDKEIGLETMCVGGGQGMAMLLERLS